jgi:hypothetical protein
MDVHVVMVCVLAVGFLLAVADLGDKKRKQPRQPRQRTYQTLPRPRRRTRR